MRPTSSRVRVALVCGVCGARNYKKFRSVRADVAVGSDDRGSRLTLRKFCPHCNRHTEHRESK